MEFRIILKILTLSLLAWNVISVEELTGNVLNVLVIYYTPTEGLHES